MAGIDPFAPIVADDKVSPDFRALRDLPGFAPAREMIREISLSFIDKDGNFVEQFQTTGLDARTWELFLHAVLLEAGAVIDSSAQSPDYVFEVEGLRVGMEAVTANPTQLEGVEVHIPEDLDILDYQRNDRAIKLGSALYSKLGKEYWKLEHMRGVPLIIAIEDFHFDKSLLFSDASLWQYLYGFVGEWYTDSSGTLHISQSPIAEHKAGDKVIPSGFFGLQGAENISGVLFGNSGTLPKFNRMAFLAGLGREQDIRMFRRGSSYSHDPNSALPNVFAYEVGDPSAPNELWAQGLSLFHNPNAVCPLPHGFVGLTYHFLDDTGEMRSFLPDFHPMGSVTMVVTPTATEIASDTPPEPV